MGIVAAVAGVASSIDQKKASERAEERRVKANRVEKARAEVTRGIERKRAAARVRQAMAFNAAGAASQGIVEGSSAVQGAQSTLGSNFGTSVAQANRSFVSQQQSFDLRQRATFTEQNAQANAAMVRAGGQLLTTIDEKTEGAFSPFA